MKSTSAVDIPVCDDVATTSDAAEPSDLSTPALRAYA